MATLDMFGNLIGAGEESAVQILCEVLGVPRRTFTDYPLPGIYTQIKFTKLFNQETIDFLDKVHKKGSLGILAVTNRKEKLAVRVQGKDHTGRGKSLKDNVHEGLFKDIKIKTVDLHIRECEQLFKERINYISYWEVCSALMTAGVKA